MSRYYVSVIGPSGQRTYVVRASRETAIAGAASRYHYPSDARRARDSYEEKLRHTPRVKRMPVFQILDDKDPERVVL